MAIDYRYHLASLLAVFVALLLGILIGIGLAPNPEELDQVVSNLRKQYEQTRNEKAEDLARAEDELGEATAVGKAAVASVIEGRLQGRQVAIVLDHEFSRGFAEDLGGWLTQAGARVVSTTTVTRRFVTMTEADRARLSQRLLFYPPADTPFRAALAQALARDLTSGRERLTASLEANGLLRIGPGSRSSMRPDTVLIVGGADAAGEVLPEQIDVPLIGELQRLGARVVGCETGAAKLSCIPHYKARGITTVDNVDRLSGRLAVVLALAGAQGHFGTKDTADDLLPDIPPYGG